MPFMDDVAGYQRRSILARAAVLHAGRAQLGDLLALDSRTLRRRKVVTDFLVTSLSVPRQLPPRQRDAESIRWVASEWGAHLSRSADYEYKGVDEPKGVVAPLLADLEAAVSEVSTENQVEVLFRDVAAFCASRYAPHCWHEPRLEIAITTVNPGGPAHPYAVTAETARDADGCTVTVQFNVEDFGPETYACLPRLLMHECFCHAAAGHPLDDVDNASPFVEGWLDWAAGLHFDSWISCHDEGFAAVSQEHGRLLMKSALNRVNTDERWCRVTGKRAAEALRDWFRREAGPEPDVNVLTAQLALEVNQLPDRLVTKDALTAKVCSPSTSLRAALLEWAKGGAHAADVLAAVL